MSVYFVYRCPYVAPAGNHFKRFDGDDTVLDWFRSRWHRLADKDYKVVGKRMEREMGCRHVYGFFSLFEEIAVQALPLPTTLQDLFGHLYANAVTIDSPHALQVCIDDDEFGLAYYFFDDHFLKKYPKRTAWVAREDWRLPDGCGPGGMRSTEPTDASKPRGPWQGTTYLVELDSPGDMDDLCPAYRIDGARLPDLARHLMRCTLDGGSCAGPLLWMRDMIAIEPFGCDPLEGSFLEALRDNPDDQAAWNAYSDWLQERGERSANSHLLHRALVRLGLYGDDTWRKYPKLPKKLADIDTWAADIGTAARIMRPIAHAADRAAQSSRSLVQVGEHVAQLCLHKSYWEYGKRDIYHHWIEWHFRALKSSLRRTPNAER
jgi:uncharacterized protein (TIGR02996 family)